MNDDLIPSREAHPNRRETDQHGWWYRTLFRSYLYRPPVWIYVIEMLFVAGMTYVVTDENVRLFSRLYSLFIGRAS